MKILDITEVKLEWLDLSQLTQHKPKPYELVKGTVGVTQILRYIATTIGTLKLHQEDVEDLPWRMLVGMGWETMAAQLYPDMMWPAKHLVNGGIVGHPDATSVLSGLLGDEYLDSVMCVDEFKYTAKSMREKGAKPTDYKDIRREWLWNGQMMSYLYQLANSRFGWAMNGQYIGRFHVLWAMGCYEKFTLDERYLRYTIKYEEAEIERHWKMMEANEEATRRKLGL